MLIRHATIEDIDELIRLTGEWLNPLWHKIIKRGYLHIILKNYELTCFTQHYVYVADSEKDGIVGFIDFLVWGDWVTKKWKLMIQHVYVSPNHRRKGVGSNLIKTAIKDFEPDFVFVDTKPEKFPYAQSLYEKMGMKENPKRKWLERYIDE